jgi:hypothetical protein
MLPAGTSVAALGTPKGVKQLPASTLESPRVVEGSLVSPMSEAARVAALPPAGPAAQPLQAAAAAATPAPVKKRGRPPERFAVYLAIFAVLALGITIAACAALAIIVQQNFFQ